VAGVEAQERREIHAQIAIGEPVRQQTVQDQEAQERLHTGVGEGQRGDALVAHDLRAGHLAEGLLTEEAIVAEVLDVKQTSIGLEADHP